MKEIPWTIDDGILLGVPVHDGLLTRLCFTSGDGGDCLDLEIAHPQGSKAKLSFSGIIKMNLIEVWNTPIIFSILACKVGELPEKDSLGPQGVWTRLQTGRVGSSEALAKDLARAKASYSEAFLVEVECSYGGTMLVVCRRIQMYAV